MTNIFSIGSVNFSYTYLLNNVYNNITILCNFGYLEKGEMYSTCKKSGDQFIFTRKYSTFDSEIGIDSDTGNLNGLYINYKDSDDIANQMESMTMNKNGRNGWGNEYTN